MPGVVEETSLASMASILLLSENSFLIPDSPFPIKFALKDEKAHETSKLGKE